MVAFADIQSAAAQIAGQANHTPIMTSRMLDAQLGLQVFFKCEHLQRTGSFKFRGAYNALSRLDAAQRRAGVVAFSSGNHAQGVALAAQLLGIPAVICMPTDAPAVKVAATLGYGAEVVRYDRLTQDREAVARALATERGLTLIPPFDHPDIIAGQGTVADELCRAVPDLDTLLVPVGGGGLLSGCAIAAHGHNPAIRVYGVEPAQADDTAQSLRRGERVTIPAPDTIADGLRPTAPGRLTFPILQAHVTDIITVSEAEIIHGTRFVYERLKQAIEPSAGTGPGALLAGKLPPGCQRVGVILCGGNIEPEVLRTLWDD
jgi:threonine dehydratase